MRTGTSLWSMLRCLRVGVGGDDWGETSRAAHENAGFRLVNPTGFITAAILQDPPSCV
jgi:hypothetical protein